MNKEKILFISMIVCISILSINSFLIYINVDRMTRVTDNFEHIYHNGSIKNVEGVNIPGCGFMVVTKNKNWSEIVDISVHEQCHELVYEDNNHYCN